MNNISLGEKISKYRKEKGFTQSELAEKLNVSPQAVSKWETNQSAPDISTLLPLAKLLDISVDELLSSDEKVEPDTIYKPEKVKKDVDKMVLKIRILSNDGDKVRINVPYILFKEGIKFGNSSFGIGGENIKIDDETFNKINELIEVGVIGKLVEIESADGDIVEIYVE